MSANRKARGGLAFRIAPEQPPAAPPICFACALVASIALWFAVVFGGLHLIARLLP